MKHFNCKSAFGYLSILLILIYPTIYFALKESAGISYIITSIVYALPVAYIILLIPYRWLFYLIMIFTTMIQIVEYSMVDLYGGYLLSGNIVSTINTTSQEAGEFFTTNICIWYKWAPIILLCLASCLLYQKQLYNKWVITKLAVCLIVPILFVIGKLSFSYKFVLTPRYFANTRIWNRPPYNIVYQCYNTYEYYRLRSEINNSNNVKFGAHKVKQIGKNEIYVLAIGESLRYDNISLNGLYKRKTTPELEKLNNIVLFNDYYSTACLTMFSVPMLMTRATPLDYELNYKEKSIFEPFKECEFKTYAVISETNLLSYETYLTDGVDSLIIVPNIVKDGVILSGDKTIATIMDSLMNVNEKVFIICQFMGNHSFFTNYEKNFDVYKPNINSCKDKCESDSLFINAYDNTILYHDSILSTIIHSMDRPNTVSAFTFVSDHGEHIGKTGAGHGGDCNPIKIEYHVPYIFWYSNDYALLNQDKIDLAKNRLNAKLNADNLFYSICGMADIELDEQYSMQEYNVFSPQFTEHRRFILVPDGRNYVEAE